MVGIRFLNPAWGGLSAGIPSLGEEAPQVPKSKICVYRPAIFCVCPLSSNSRDFTCLAVNSETLAFSIVTMETAAMQREGWLAWLRGSLWTQPGTASDAAASEGERTSPANPPQPGLSPHRASGARTADDGSEGRQVSGREKEERALKNSMRLVWAFFQEEGWRFVNGHSWSVELPATATAEGGGACSTGAENGSGAQQQGPMPLGQVRCALLRPPGV